MEAQTQTFQTALAVTSNSLESGKVAVDVSNTELFVAAFNSSPVGIIISRLSDGFVVDANNAFLQMIECSREDAIGKHTVELGIFESIAQRENLVNGLKKGKIQNQEMKIKSRSGKHLTVIASIDKIYLNDEEYILTTAMDITEGRKAEQELKVSDQKYRLLFSHMTNGFAYCKMIYDELGNPIDFLYLEANDAFETLTGLKKQTIIGKHITEAIPTIKREHPEILEIYGRVASTGVSEQFEVYFNPLSVWLSISVYSFKKGYFATVFENITEKKQIEKLVAEYSKGLELTVADRTQQLVEAQDRLLKAERLSAIGELAGMVGHDLRNPLTGIKNAVYILKKNQGTLIGQNTTEMLSIIERSVDHANGIVRDLLDYSRELHLELEEYSPKSLLNYVLLALKIPKGIKVVQNAEDVGSLWVDANKMERVFTNLSSNAFEAMPNGGTLEISIKQNGENVEFVFADTGSGMSENVLSKIFTPLFTTKARGMGFGLAICKRIIEAHKGKVTVESSPGRGTKFYVSLPVAQPEIS